jgi:hypothetical protein
LIEKRDGLGLIHDLSSFSFPISSPISDPIVKSRAKTIDSARAPRFSHNSGTPVREREERLIPRKIARERKRTIRGSPMRDSLHFINTEEGESLCAA